MGKRTPSYEGVRLRRSRRFIIYGNNGMVRGKIKVKDFAKRASAGL